MIAYLIFIVSHLILILGSISINAVSVAFPDMASSLNTSLVTSGWVLSVYLLVFTISAVLMGKINEIFGKKQTFLACAAFFVCYCS
jgi:MFS family permease